MLAALNVLAFVVLVAANGGALPLRPDVLAAWGANVGVLTAAGEWWRLPTAAFLHLGVAHLALNVWALWSLGRDAERHYGSATYTAIYFATAVLASLGSVAWDPSRTSVGASGAIFGIGGAFLAFLAREGTNLPAGVARTHWIATGVFVVASLAAGVLIPGIDNAAHVAGLASGFALGWLLARPLDDETRGGAARARLAAAGLAGLALVAGIAFVRAPGPHAGGLHAFWAAHPWYAAGESASFATWERLARDADAGLLPMGEFASALERDVLPFWERAPARLEADGRSGVAADPYRERVLELARLRRALARAQVAAARADGDLDATRPLAEAVMLAQARIEYATMRDVLAAQSRGLAARLRFDGVRNRIAARGRCVRPLPGAVRGVPGALDSPRDAPALAMAVACESQRLFLAGRYRELDAALAAHLARPNDLPDGSSSLTGAFSGFDFLFAGSGTDVRRLLPRLADWRREVPGSVAPELVEAQALRAWAREAPGRDGAAAPPDRPPRRLRDEMANEALRRAAEAGADHPVWYTLSMIGAVDDPGGIVAGRALFEAGVERFPTHHPLYYAMLRLLQPRTLGSFEQVAAFVDEVTARAPGGESAALYARLYAYYAALEGDDADIYADVGADWPTIERGFRQLLERHPDSDFLLNAFANLACRRGDAAAYRSLREAVGTRRSSAAWQGDVQVETCDARLLPGRGDLSAAADPSRPAR
jgi:membrane associated rhomboid family serine protease